MQEGPEALGHREDPLPGGEIGQHVVGEVSGKLGHAPGVAGGADPSALAGEGDQSLVAAILTASPSEPVGEDAAAQVAPEVLLDPPGHATAQRVGFDCVGEEGLQVVLDDRIERRGGRPSWSIRGRGGRTRWPGR